MDVGADVRNAAKWALGQLSEGDLKPLAINALSGLLFGDTRGLHWKNSEDGLFQAMLGKGSYSTRFSNRFFGLSLALLHSTSFLERAVIATNERVFP